LRIDRHECRKAAIEFLIHNYEVTDTLKLDGLIKQYIKSLPMDYEYYSFTIEIIRGLLVDRKYCVITDRWIMGILDEHLQSELRVPDLSILRVAGYELLTHPEIPTTVIVNEVNVLSKMYCPEKQSLLHASVNRMIETQISIGNELALEQGASGSKKRHDPLSALVGLDQEAQLAMILLDQRRRNKRNNDDEEPSSDDQDEPKVPGGGLFAAAAMVASRQNSSNPSPLTSPRNTGIKTDKIPLGFVPAKKNFQIKIGPVGARESIPISTGPTRVNASTQTVRDPTIEPGVRIYRLL
jgi:transcription termination factor NusB